MKDNFISFKILFRKFSNFKFDMVKKFKKSKNHNKIFWIRACNFLRAFSKILKNYTFAAAHHTLQTHYQP